MNGNHVKSKNIQNDKIIRLDSGIDLAKITLEEIENTKIYNIKGKYFDKLYDEALKREMKELGLSPNRNNVKKVNSFNSLKNNIMKNLSDLKEIEISLFYPAKVLI